MSYYKYRTEGKALNNFKEKTDQTLEASIELAPNVKYNLHDKYNIQGVGEVFEGQYQVKKITKRIEVTGMTVTAEVVKV